MPKKTTLKIRTRFEGYHRWPNAPTEVSFLRDLHRHIFLVSADLEVEDHDRELEFFLVQKMINAACAKLLVENSKRDGRMSCEHMADFLIDYLKVEFELPVVAVTVGEDGENEATVELV